LEVAQSKKKEGDTNHFVSKWEGDKDSKTKENPSDRKVTIKILCAEALFVKMKKKKKKTLMVKRKS